MLDTDANHRRELLTAHLRRLLVIEAQIAQRPDDVTLALAHDDTTAQINALAAPAGLGKLPEALPAIAAATGLRDEVSAGLQRQQRQLTAYYRAAELQYAAGSPMAQVTLKLQLDETKARLAALAQQLAALGSAPPAPSIPSPPPTTLPETPPMPTLALSSDQLARLRALLGRCDELDTNRVLRALFADPRIGPWRGGLPDADSLKGRVDLLISYLRDKRTTAGAHALVLLLWVLAEKYDPADERHDTLLTLASELTYGVRVALPPNSSTNPQFERTIRTLNGMLDPNVWIASLAAIKPRVCRITVAFGGTTAHGTGFLLAPDIVITNYHVVERVLTGKAPPSSVSLLFDYHLGEDGVTPHSGPSYTLAAHDWLIDSSPYSPFDLQADAGGAPAPEHLDYALLRSAGAPGHQQVAGDVAGVTPSPRGWITLPTEAYPFTAQTPLLILQHPDGKELKLAIDTDAIIGVNSNGTRVRYRTNTEAGSSGAPCFDAHWNLVALHHAGDPNYAALHQPSYNQGIPLTAILTLLQERGKLALLNGTA